MANFLTYNVKDEGTIGASKQIVFNDTTAEHKITLSAATTLSFNVTAVTPEVFKRLIRIVMPSTVYGITWPNNISWNRGFALCANVPSQEYLVELFTYDGGDTWCASWLCETEVD